MSSKVRQRKGESKKEYLERLEASYQEGMKRAVEAAMQLHFKEGPFYEIWKETMIEYAEKLKSGKG